MIDYEKLKKAHELQKKLCLGSSGSLTIRVRIIAYGDGKVITDYMTYDGNISTGYYTNLDDIIIELTELTQPQPKYKMGDKVWIMDGSYTYGLYEIESIERPIIGRNEIALLYGLKNRRKLVHEDLIHPAKLALIQAQCDYWNKLEDEELKKDSNGQIIPHILDNSGFVTSQEIEDKNNFMTGRPKECHKECQHEDSGNGNMLLSYPAKIQCGKCNQYYIPFSINKCEHISHHGVNFTKEPKNLCIKFFG